MIDEKIHDESVKQLGHLSLSQQRRVLEFARSLSDSSLGVRGISGSELAKFAGTISSENCEATMAEIDAGCEQVDK